MTSTQNPASPTGTHEPNRTADSSGTRTPATRRSSSSMLITERGRTAIADTVVEKIAAIAAREVPGVHDLGAGITRTFGALRERIPGSSRSTGQGVSVEVGERQAAADIDLVAEYGVAIHELAASVRQNVIGAIEGLTGLEVTEVNINVDDVYLESDGSSERSESRVQ
jgi:uncharacterized alkaline shock family protein YloU